MTTIYDYGINPLDYNGKQVDVARVVDGALVGPDGTMDHFPYPPNPNGLDWLTDTLHGFDIYERGFVARPTLFFDPQATGSMGRGTFTHPYTTQAQLEKVIKGDMSGQVLGMKRGSRINGGTSVAGFAGNTLTLNPYGRADDPFIICPYGDAEALPIISGQATLTWTLYHAGLNIWSASLATERDVWQDDVRLWKTVWNTNAETTLASTEGRSTYNGGTLYIRLASGDTPSNTEILINQYGSLRIIPYDTSASGYIHVAGLDCRYSVQPTLLIDAASFSLSGISTLEDISVVGCRVHKSGVDESTDNVGVGNGITVYGNTDAVRLGNLYIAGNECFDHLHNAIEIKSIGGTKSIVEHNYTHNNGAVGVELWASYDNIDCRYNYISNHHMRYAAQTHNNTAGQGFYLANYYISAPNTVAGDTTHLKNHDINIYFNLIENMRVRALKFSGGASVKFHHNTFYNNSDEIFGVGVGAANPQGIFTEGTAPIGSLNISNNIFYNEATEAETRSTQFLDVSTAVGANASVPSGDYNFYHTLDGYASGSWYATDAGFDGVGDDSTGNFVNYKAAMLAYSLDQNSLACTKLNGGTISEAQSGMNPETYTPLAANLVGSTALIGIGTRYFDGQPYDPSTATIGAFKGT